VAENGQEELKTGEVRRSRKRDLGHHKLGLLMVCLFTAYTISYMLRVLLRGVFEK